MSTQKSLKKIICIMMMLMVGAVFTMPMEANAASVKPSKVKNVKVVGYDYNKAKITWSKAKKAKKYKVYRATKKSGKYKVVKTTKKRSYVNSGLKTGKKYFYKVRAVNGKKKGSFSKVKSVTIKPRTVKTPTVKVSNDMNITVSWKSAKGASGYAVYRSEKADSGYKLIGTTTGKTYKDKKYDPRKTQYYKVKAYKKYSGKKVYGKSSHKKSGKPQNVEVFLTKTEEHIFCSACDEDLTNMTDEEKTAHSKLTMTVTDWTCAACGETFTSEEEANAHIDEHKSEGVETECTTSEREIEHGTETYTKEVPVKESHYHAWTPVWEDVTTTTYKTETYTAYICNVCGKDLTEWDDELMESGYTLEDDEYYESNWYKHSYNHIVNDGKYGTHTEQRDKKTPITKTEHKITKYTCECGEIMNVK